MIQPLLHSTSKKVTQCLSPRDLKPLIKIYFNKWTSSSENFQILPNKFNFKLSCPNILYRVTIPHQTTSFPTTCLKNTIFNNLDLLRKWEQPDNWRLDFNKKVQRKWKKINKNLLNQFFWEYLWWNWWHLKDNLNAVAAP